MVFGRYLPIPLPFRNFLTIDDDDDGYWLLGQRASCMQQSRVFKYPIQTSRVDHRDHHRRSPTLTESAAAESCVFLPARSVDN